MPKALTPHCNFNAGEWSPLAKGRFDLVQYPNALGCAENFLLHQIGGAMFAPGTVYAGSVKDPTKKTKIMKFSFSSTQNYIVEVGYHYFRFWANNGQVLNGGNPVEIVTPYDSADVFQIHRAQDEDTMYITSPLNTYKPYKLVRLASNSFSMTPVSFIRGPFLDDNITKLTITPSSATGNVNLVVTVPAWGAGIAYVPGPDMPDYVTNGGSTYKCLVANVGGSTFAADLASGYWALAATVPVFQAGHVGSLWKINTGVVKILTVSDGLHATAAVQSEPEGVAGTLTSASAFTLWAEAAFSDVRGWPATCQFHEQRLYYANTTYQPKSGWGSVINAPDNFKVDANVDSAAVDFTVSDVQGNAIRWMASCPSSLQAGTSGGTFTIQSGTAGATISAKNINVNNDTNYPTAAIQPEKISSYLYYLQANLFQVRELYYDYLKNRQLAADMCIFADHILRDGGGAVEMAHQQSPNDRIWVLRADGQIAVLVRNAEQQVMGWSRLTAGASSGGEGLFESLALLLVDGADDQIWVIVNRVINGSVCRFVEYFSAETFVNQWEPIRLSCALALNTPITITGFTNANPVVVTASSHGFSNGDQIKIDLVSVVGVGPNGFPKVVSSPLNGNIYIVAGVTTHTFQLKDELGNTIDGTSFGTYSSGGKVWKMVSTISGFDHLIGETISVQTDGAIPAAQQRFLVDGSGQITLPNKSAQIIGGLPYRGKLQLLRITEGGQGVMRRIYEAYLRVDRTLGLKIGKKDDPKFLKPMVIQTPKNPPLGHPVPLYTGDIPMPIDGGWATDDEIVIVQDQPLPAMLLCVLLKSETETKD